MHSVNIQFLNGLNLSPNQASSLKAIGEYKGRQDLYTRQTPEVLESLRQVAIVESIESSNRIEGVTAPHSRIEAIALKSTAPKDRSEQEIAGYRDALGLIHESSDHMPFSLNVVLQMHSMLYRYMPQDGGRWKSADNVIADKGTDGTVKRIRFRPVSALKTPQAMDALVKNYDEAIHTGTDSLIVIPLMVLDFLCVHPFQDGNGRVARLLTLLTLYHFDYRVGQYISIERIFEESRETYYDTLEASSQGWHKGRHDPHPWLNYFWGVIIRAYREFEERVGTIREGKGSKTDQIHQAVARRTGPFAISDIERDCPGVSRDWIRVVLRQLRDEGIIVSQGKGRGAKWVRKEQLPQRPHREQKGLFNGK